MPWVHSATSQLPWALTSLFSLSWFLVSSTCPQSPPPHIRTLKTHSHCDANQLSLPVFAKPYITVLLFWALYLPVILAMTCCWLFPPSKAFWPYRHPGFPGFEVYEWNQQMNDLLLLNCDWTDGYALLGHMMFYIFLWICPPSCGIGTGSCVNLLLMHINSYKVKMPD